MTHLEQQLPGTNNPAAPSAPNTSALDARWSQWAARDVHPDATAHRRLILLGVGAAVMATAILAWAILV